MNNVEVVSKLGDWFSTKLQCIQYHDDTKAYVVGVLSKYKKIDEKEDLSNSSIILEYVYASETSSFASYQKIGDWVLWCSVLHPEHIKDYRRLILNTGQMSYYSCYKIMNKSWPVYENLADSLPVIVNDVRTALFLSK